MLLFHLAGAAAAAMLAIIRGERPPLQPETSVEAISYAPWWDVATRCWSQGPKDRPSMQSICVTLG